MRPYRNLKSENLPLMLFLARAIAYLSVILFVVNIVSFINMTFLSSGIMGATAGLNLFLEAFTLLVISSLLAAVVAFEENYRRRTEHLLSQSET